MPPPPNFIFCSMASIWESKRQGSLWIHTAVTRPFCFCLGFSLRGGLAARGGHYSCFLPAVPGRDGRCQAEGWHVLAHPDSLSSTLEWQAGGCQRREERGREMKGGGGGAGLVHRVLASEAKAKARPKQMGKQTPKQEHAGEPGRNGARRPGACSK